MPVGVTELSRDIHGLHMLIFWICVLIAFAVFGVMIYSIVKFRHSQGAVAGHLRSHHQGRDHLDHHSGRDPGRHGHPGRRHAGEDRGHAQLRTSPSRSPAISGSGNTSTSIRRSKFFSTLARDSNEPPVRPARASIRTRSTTTCSKSTSRWSCRSARRCACCSPRTT